MTPALAQQHEAHKALTHRVILKGMAKPLWFSMESEARSIADIQRTIAGRYGVTRLDILSSRRSERVVAPRRIAMYLAHKLTSHASGTIGRHFNRDHSTILVAVKKMERMMSVDGELRAEVATLEAILGATP